MFEFLRIELKHEAWRKSIRIALDRLVARRREVTGNPHAADSKTFIGSPLNRQGADESTSIVNVLTIARRHHCILRGSG